MNQAKGLPAGWQSAVRAGDPSKRGPYVERVKLPPNATVPPHTHPDVENITVLWVCSASARARWLKSPRGRSHGRILYQLPANTPHFAWAGLNGAVIQIHGVGPTGIKMLQSAPRSRLNGAVLRRHFPDECLCHVFMFGGRRKAKREPPR